MFMQGTRVRAFLCKCMFEHVGLAHMCEFFPCSLQMYVCTGGLSVWERHDTRIQHLYSISLHLLIITVLSLGTSV